MTVCWFTYSTSSEELLELISMASSGSDSMSTWKGNSDEGSDRQITPKVLSGSGKNSHLFQPLDWDEGWCAKTVDKFQISRSSLLHLKQSFNGCVGKSQEMHISLILGMSNILWMVWSLVNKCSLFLPQFSPAWALPSQSCWETFPHPILWQFLSHSPFKYCILTDRVKYAFSIFHASKKLLKI